MCPAGCCTAAFLLVYAAMSLPLIVQNDGLILLELGCPQSEEARSEITKFAELEKSPEHVHSYRLTPLSIWNAAEIKIDADTIYALLVRFSRYPVAADLLGYIREISHRYGLLQLKLVDQDTLELHSTDEQLWHYLKNQRKLSKFLTARETSYFELHKLNRGSVKIELMRLGYPVVDLAPLETGTSLSIELRSQSLSKLPFQLRSYQKEAVRLFSDSGFGVIELPCGAGKTIVGLALMAKLGYETLILVPSKTSAEQWRREILDKTTLEADSCQIYSSQQKQLASITIVTYQMLTWRANKTDDFPHFSLFAARNWGLIIYDEVHLLPAPVFRFVAELQAKRRVGFTGTLVREDDQEDVIFALIGPRRYNVAWKDMERDGWLAEVECCEIRIPLSQEDRLVYALANAREKGRLAAENKAKYIYVKRLIKDNPCRKTLIIGQYIRQLEFIAQELTLPLLTGRTSAKNTEELYQQFREGKITTLVVSKVANCAVDLPEADMAIQISGSFGSRQEEAQRLGRLLRPKERAALFYTIVSRFTMEEDYALRRRQFLLEQGYKYKTEVYDE